MNLIRLIGTKYPIQVTKKFFNLISLAKDFISHLMCCDPDARYSCELALAHPWYCYFYFF